jgi:hypothetical protein
MLDRLDNINRNLSINDIRPAYASSREIEEIRKAMLENDDTKQNIELREKYANKIFWLIVSWTIFVFALLLFEGLHIGREFIGDKLIRTYKLDWDVEVVITIIGTTITQILGLMLIVLKYLFKNN